MSAGCSRTSTATPGVGRTPARSATPPAEAMPAHSASSSSGPERRVSARRAPPAGAVPPRVAHVPARGAPERQRELRAEGWAVRDAAHAVGAEQAAGHGRPLALRELRAPAGGLQAGLLALDLAGVTREEALALELGAEFGSASTSARAMPWRSAPAWPVSPPPWQRAWTSKRSCRPASTSGDSAVVRCVAAREVVLEGAAVHGHRAVPGLEDDAGDGRLALAGAAVRGVLSQVGLAPRPRRAASGSGPRAGAPARRTA